MKVIGRNNYFGNLGTAYSVGAKVSLDLKGDTAEKVGTYVERRDDPTSPKSPDAEMNPIGLSGARTWTREYENGWNHAFGNGAAAVPIIIEDNEFNDVGVVYKGRDDAEVAIRRNKNNGVGVVALTSPSGILFADGKKVIELPVPEGIEQEDINELIEIVARAKSEGSDVHEAAKNSKFWEKLLSLGANVVTIAQPIIESIKLIV